MTEPPFSSLFTITFGSNDYSGMNTIFPETMETEEQSTQTTQIFSSPESTLLTSSTNMQPSTTTMDTNQQISEIENSISEKEEEKTELEEKSSTLTEVNDKIDEIISSSSRGIFEKLLNINLFSTSMHTCSEFNGILELFISSLQSGTTDWINLADEMVNAEVEACSDEEIASMQASKATNEALMDEIESQIEQLEIEIQELQEQLAELQAGTNFLISQLTKLSILTSTSMTGKKGNEHDLQYPGGQSLNTVCQMKSNCYSLIYSSLTIPLTLTKT